MKFELPETIQAICQKLVNKQFQLYLVGGTIRDWLMHRPTKDYDFTTDATPEQMLELLPDAFYDNQFGTVGVPTEQYGTIEITTFRSDKGYSYNRPPDEVVWGHSIEEDLKRRGFTINAIALLVSNHELQMTNQEIIDPYSGQRDLKNKLIRAVGDPNERFT